MVKNYIGSVYALGCLLILSFFMVGCGPNTIQRDQAETMIKAAIEGAGETKLVETFEITFGSRGATYYVSYIGLDEYERAHKTHELVDRFVKAPGKWNDLVKKGFAEYTILAKKVPSDAPNFSKHWPGQLVCPFTSTCYYYDAFSLSFTQTATPYVRSFVDNRGAYVEIHVATLDKITVTGLTAPSETGGNKTVHAEYTAEFKLTPIGEIYSSSGVSYKGTADFALYDDGWRLANRSQHRN